MKRWTFAAILSLAIVGTVMVNYRGIAHAFSCNTWWSCGYFTKQGPGSAWYDVFPKPALNNVWDNNALINTVSSYLYSGSTRNRMGAAFIIDNMLGYQGKYGDAVGGGYGNGWNYANAHFGDWVNLVNYYYFSSNPAEYGINFNYWPSQQSFCSGRVDSGYDNNGFPNYTGINDEILYYTPAYGTSNCNWEYSNSMPELHFYWAGGSFDIGKGCGNLQDTTNVVPVKDNDPSGSISVACNAATGQQTATITFSDPDAGTSGYVTTSGPAGPWQSATYANGSNISVPIPKPPTTDPYVTQAVILHVLDSGPVAPPNRYLTWNASTQVPCISVGCGSLTVTPTVLDPYTIYSLQVGASVNAGMSPPSPDNFQLTVLSPSNTSIYTASMSGTNSGNTATATFANIPKTSSSGFGAGTYTARWIFSGGGLAPLTCTQTFPVVYLPYLNVYGGDVAVGASPAYAAGTSTCGMDTFGGVYSWNNHTAGYSGAGAQYAVQALAGVVDFASALSSSNTPPVGLSYANYFSPVDPTKVNPPTGLFGGYFGAITADCDYTSDLTIAPVTIDTTIPATTVPTSTASIKYVSGADVFISGNIIYAGTGGWIDVSTIPSFKLVVVGGDIYIDRNVTQLDGIYVAESSGANGGRIFTCATGLRAPVNLATNGAYTTCNKQLVINGAFVAKYVSFSRTYGTIGQATVGDSLTSNHDAEVFNYTPELWLPRSVSPANNGYTAVTGLPPVL